jgi:hypothetical protein
MPGTTYLPGFGEVRYDLTPVADYGDGQTSAVIGLMAKYAAEDSESTEVRQAVAAAQRLYSGLTPEEQVYRFARSRIRFINDEALSQPFQRWYQDYIVETLIRPRDLLTLPVPVAQGDCDDFSMLVASMLLAQGIKASFVTVAADDRDPNQFSHVYVASYRDGKRFPIDASHGPFAGWEVQGVYRRTEWPVRKAVTLDLDIDRMRVPLIALGIIGAVVLSSRR